MPQSNTVMGQYMSDRRRGRGVVLRAAVSFSHRPLSERSDSTRRKRQRAGGPPDPSTTFHQNEPPPARGGAAPPSRHPHAPPHRHRPGRVRLGRRDRRARLAGEGSRAALRRGLGAPGLRRDVPGAEPGLAPGDRRSTTSSSPTAKPRRWRRCARSTPALPRTPTRSTGRPVVPGADRRRHGRLRPVEADLDLPYADGGIAWDPSLVFPGLRRGEHLESQVDLAPRAPILAADGTPLADGPADAREHPLGSSAIDVTGEVGMAEPTDLAGPRQAGLLPRHPGRDQRPRAGLQRPPRRQARRLAAGGRRLGGSARILAQAEPRAGAPVKTTIDPDLQYSAVSALAGRSGGVAVLDARNGERPRPRRPGLLRPPAPRLHLQDDHHHRRPAEGRRLPRRLLRNHSTGSTSAAASSATPTASTAAAPSAKPSPSRATRTSPRSARRSATTTWSATAERFGFNSPPTLYAPRIVREVELPESTIPTRSATTSTSASARSARARCWRRRCRWRASPRRSPTTASASRPRSSPTGSCAPTPSRCG